MLYSRPQRFGPHPQGARAEALASRHGRSARSRTFTGAASGRTDAQARRPLAGTLYLYTTRPHHMNLFRSRLDTRLLLPVAAALLFTALAACAADSQQPAIPPTAGIHSWYENGSGGRYVAPVIAGSVRALASGGRIGVVLSDTDCTPDAQGLSHCRNGIAFADGTRITIVDHHQMSRFRCLRPGERVRVSLLEGKWVRLQTGV